jgi:hypothetical protein
LGIFNLPVATKAGELSSAKRCAVNIPRPPASRIVGHYNDAQADSCSSRFTTSAAV